jgi:prepilin-type N-terminal cleavage/methylation domain-containing protein
MNIIKNQGFTLIELLIVIGIIAILAAAVIITVTPGERLLDAREATRASHMAAIGNAIHTTIATQGNGLDDMADVVSGSCATQISDACAVIIGLGSTAPLDPSGGNYTITASGERVIVKPANSESEWYTDGRTY